MAKKRYTCRRWPNYQVGSVARVYVEFENGVFETDKKTEQKFIESLNEFGVQIRLVEEEPPEEPPKDDENPEVPPVAPPSANQGAVGAGGRK